MSVKVKEFVVLGVLASRGLQYGVEAHMRRALDYGATRDELFEAIKAAAVPGGGVAYSVGVGYPPKPGHFVFSITYHKGLMALPRPGQLIDV